MKIRLIDIKRIFLLGANLIKTRQVALGLRTVIKMNLVRVDDVGHADVVRLPL